MNDIHARIKRLRIDSGLSMEALAKAVGVTWQTIQQWERNTAPKRTRLDSVANALGTSVEYLMTGRARSGNIYRLEQPTAAPYIHPDPAVAQVVAMMESTDLYGKMMALGAVKSALTGYQPAKPNHAS